MTETELAGLVAAEIADSIDYDRSELAQDRGTAIEYYRGEMNDLPYEEGRSSLTDHTAADVIGWMLPGLMRVFFSSDRLGEYEPQTPDDEEAAQQATDYVNYVFMRESNGYQICWDAFHDALLHANGVIKHFWDKTPETSIHVLSCLTEDQLAAFITDDNIEVLEHTVQDPQTLETPEGPVEVVYHDVKLKRSDSKGHLQIAAVPPEEFLIDRQAKDIEDARFVAHRTLKTRSELVEMGYDKTQVEELAGIGGSIEFDEVSLARHERIGVTSPPGHDRATEEIEVFECYVKADHDADGVAEMLRVVTAGESAEEILDWEVWEDTVPFTDVVGERVPHRWRGRSVFEDTQDIQRVKTVLLRQMLDNLYQANVPEREVVERNIINPEALFDRRIGNTIRVKEPGSVTNLAIPFVAKESLAALEYADQIIERRTGVSRATQALDLEALQNQSATAVNAAQSAAYSKIELIARNFAEGGMKRLFRCLLKLIVQHQDRPRMIRLRDEWVEMDPRGWNAAMDVVVNVGLGSGSRDRDMAFLKEISQQQAMALQMVGGVSTEYGGKLSQALQRTFTRSAEMAGLRNPEQYFPELSDEDLEQLREAKQGENKEFEFKEREFEAKSAVEIKKLEIESTDLVIKQYEAETRRMQAEATPDGGPELELRRYEIDQNIQLKREQLAAEIELKRQQLAAELELKREMGVMSNGSGAVRMGGEPG